MASVLLAGINDVIYKTTAEVVDSGILPKTADVLNTFVKASFDAVGEAVVWMRDKTKPDPPPPPPGS